MRRVIHCVGGVLSPLLANIALSVLDEHVHACRSQSLPTWRIVRYANDFVIGHPEEYRILVEQASNGQASC
jgi:retron-type reverse transcriptase